MSYKNADKEVDRLREIFFEIYVACGEDTDGLTHAPLQGTMTPDIPEAAFRAVLELRMDYEDCLDELPIDYGDA